MKAKNKIKKLKKKKENTVFTSFCRNKRLKSQGLKAGLWHSLTVFLYFTSSMWTLS